MNEARASAMGAGPTLRQHADDGRGRSRPVLVWRWPEPVQAVSSAVLGGGAQRVRWVLNAEVDRRYDRPDPIVHLRRIAVDLGLDADHGTALMTAAPVRAVVSATDGGVRCDATVGLHPVGWAAAPGHWPEPRPDPPATGTINLVCTVPASLAPGALVNAVITATEAKAQALFEAGVDGTGTATDAIVVVAPCGAGAAAYAGPRSVWGSRLARAVHRAVAEGIAREGTAGAAFDPEAGR